MSDLTMLPVLALRNTVLFPGVTTGVQVGRPATRAAIRAALEGDKRVLAVLQREDGETIDPERLHTIGTIAVINRVDETPQRIQILLTGVERGIAIRYDERDDHFVAAVGEAHEIEPDNPNNVLMQALEKELRERAFELGQRSSIPAALIRQALDSVDSHGRLADLIASYLDLPAADKQQLLETLAIEERLRQLLVIVQRRLGLLEAQDDIKSQVQQELGDRQREVYLREQLRAIREELGENDSGEELEELFEKLENIEFKPEIRREIDREFKRLLNMSSESMEAQVLRTYLETVAEMPWDRRSDEALDVPSAERILDEDHYGLPDVKDRILEHLAVLELKVKRAIQEIKAHRVSEAAADSTMDDADAEVVSESTTEPERSDSIDANIEPPIADSDSEANGVDATDDESDSDKTSPNESAYAAISKAPILLFAGPPGVGKTSIAKSIARAMGREYVRISLGGIADEADIRGHRRTYIGALPGRIMNGLRQAGTRNPVFLLDEVDKLGHSHQGDPSSALLEVLDPAQNDKFVDHYIGQPFDLSEVLFIATANYPSHIPGPLLDRMEIVEFTGYTEAEKLEIAKRYLLPRQVAEAGLDAEELAISDDAVAEVISYYTREAGVRQLEKQLGKLSRKVARRVASGDAPMSTDAQVSIAQEQVVDYLGKPRMHPEHAQRDDRVGVATGMFYTPVGGDIMFLEATTMRGKGGLTLTGQLGDVMKESAQAAWSYARAHATEFRIDDAMFERDVHIHAPAGAIPKEGPSAGIALATALISTMSGIPVRHDVAITGEITLTGRVLPIGGVKEKVLGAVRAGIREFILPKENAVDLDDLSEALREEIQVHLVETLDEALMIALRQDVFLHRNGHDSPSTRGTRPATVGHSESSGESRRTLF